MTPYELSKIVGYNPETGEFWWLPRTAEMFATPRAYAIWNANLHRRKAFTTVDSKGYLRSKIFSKTYKAHRVAWALYYGVWPDNEVDHINGVRADNRIVNLRDVGGGENQKNTKRRKDNQSGVTGVCFHQRDLRWYAYIKDDGKQVHLGYFKTLEEAQLARKDAEVSYGYHQNHGRT